MKSAKRLLRENTNQDGSLSGDKFFRAVMQHRNTPETLILRSLQPRSCLAIRLGIFCLSNLPNSDLSVSFDSIIIMINSLWPMFTPVEIILFTMNIGQTYFFFQLIRRVFIPCESSLSHRQMFQRILVAIPLFPNPVLTVILMMKKRQSVI